MIDFKTITDNADLIINGYAFTKSGDYIRVLNLNRPNKALVFDYNQEVIETSMDDIEIQIVFDYYNKNKNFRTCSISNNDNLVKRDFIFLFYLL